MKNSVIIMVIGIIVMIFLGIYPIKYLSFEYGSGILVGGIISFVFNIVDLLKTKHF